jgi:glycogen debranching enzyme
MKVTFGMCVTHSLTNEVRGVRREHRGRRLEEGMEDDSILLAYEGLDGVIRRTRLRWSPEPSEASGSELRFKMRLKPQEETAVYFMVSYESGWLTLAVRQPFDGAAAEAASVQNMARSGACEIYTSSDQFNDWLKRSMADLLIMITETPNGPYPYAGVPWYSTAFGRDGIITALECLWINPEIARCVLSYLATTQAQELIPAQDAEPGKILHETRRGEMAALGEIPLARYYGSVDATPLFVILAAAYYERTGDRIFIEAIWPNIEYALRWVDTYGDVDGDGFVEYYRRNPRGLLNQGWKDSKDSISHDDGILADGPIALCEVQGYVYVAKRRASELAALLGHTARAEELLRQALALQEHFEQAFWCEELSTYALALDGRKRLCRVRTSNAGHCLFTEIASQHPARRTGQTLLGEDMYSGWGIRTFAASQVRYNPMSYHNGSVWPHDNALIACGMSRYGLRESVLKVLTGLFDASLFVNLHRMPELFCGFPRRPGAGPTLYPVACAPQSWAAASVFLLLQACLGLSIKGPLGQLVFSYPHLPEFLEKVQIRNLRLGKGFVDLSIQRYPQNVSISIDRREGNVEIITIK